MPQEDVKRAVDALRGKGPRHTELWNYYYGDHPLIYSSERLREVFRHLDASFVENWCAAIVDSTMERLDLKRFTVTGDQEAEARLNRLWIETELSLDSDDAHEAALVTGEAFVIAWPGEGDPSTGSGRALPDVYYNDPRMVHLEYDPEQPRTKRWGAKWWRQAEKEYRLTMYYPNRLEYYQAKSDNGAVPSDGAAFLPLGDESEAKNPTGEVPIFHVRTRRNRVVGELGLSILKLQNAVNKLLSDMMVAAEYGAFRQRWIISNAELASLKNAPNEIWDLPAGDGIAQDTQAGEFGATQLSNYFTAIDKLSLAMGIISRTPKHYFFQQSGDPSGEALLAMEAPLNKKVRRYIERFTVVWRDLARFLLKLDGHDVDRWAITPVFDDPETVQPLTRAQSRNFDVNSGIPLTTVVRREGWSDVDIAQMETDRRAAQAAQQQSLAQALVEQQRRFDQEAAGDE